MIQSNARWNDAHERLGWALGAGALAMIVAIWLTGLAVHGTGPAPVAAASGGDLLRADATRPEAHALVTFVTRGDGSVSVRAASGQTAALDSARDSFVITLVRGLDRARTAAAIEVAKPYRLSRWDNGQVLLEDPSTGAQIELTAFGKTNAAAVARLIDKVR